MIASLSSMYPIKEQQHEPYLNWGLKLHLWIKENCTYHMIRKLYALLSKPTPKRGRTFQFVWCVEVAIFGVYFTHFLQRTYPQNNNTNKAPPPPGNIKYSFTSMPQSAKFVKNCKRKEAMWPDMFGTCRYYYTLNMIWYWKWWVGFLSW